MMDAKSAGSRQRRFSHEGLRELSMSIDESFAEAVRFKAPGEREEYVARVCASDPQLIARVEALLTAHDRDGTLLDVFRSLHAHR